MLFGALSMAYIFLIINLIYLSYVGRKYKHLFYGLMLIIIGLVTSYLMIMADQFTGSINSIIVTYQNLFLFTFAMGGIMYLVYVMWTMIYLIFKLVYDQVWVRYRKRIKKSVR